MKNPGSRVRELVNKTESGINVALYDGRTRLGCALVSFMMQEELTSNLDYVSVTFNKNQGKGYGRRLMAHWLIESERRGCTAATADFVNARALHTFSRAIGGQLPTRMWTGSETQNDFQVFDSYEHPKTLLSVPTEDGFPACGTVSCDVDLQNPLFINAAREVLASQATHQQ